ncbi:DNA replication and repair protein RecF [subsurface metagenome]
MIRELQIKNWKCHDNLYLEFKKGVNFIIGDNGIGKTSILEAIVFGLIGRVRRKPEKNFKRIGSTGDVEVSLKFEQNNKKYEIRRSLLGRGTTRLTRPPEGDLTDPKDISQLILKIFNSNQAFLENILYSPEGETYEFLKLNSKELVNYLENLIGIGKIREFRNLVSNLQQFFEKKKRENEDYIKTFKDFKIKEDFGDKIQLEGDSQLLKGKLTSLELEIKSKKDEISKIQKKIDEKYNKNYDYKILLSKTEKKYKQNQDIFLDLNLDEFSIQKLLSKKEIIASIVNDYSEKLEIKNQEIKDQEKKILENELRLEENDKIKSIIDKLKINYDLKTKVFCPLCKKVLSKNEFLQVHKDTIDESGALEKDLGKIKQEIKNNKNIGRDLKYKYKNYEELAGFLESIRNYNDEKFKQIGSSIQKYEKEMTQRNNELKKIEDKQYSLGKKLREIKDKLRDIKTAEKVKDVLKFNKKYRENIKGALICDITSDALDKVLNKQRDLNLTDLVDEIKKIWNIFFPYEDRDLYFDNKYIPYFKKKSETIPFDNVSAGEKMILLVLIKTILLKKYTKIPFLILDEPLEHLSFENRINIIDYLVEIYNKGLIKQLIITTFEESLTRKLRNLKDVHIISLPTLKKYIL